MNNDLKLIENELVPVYETDKGEKVVYGTELHEILGVRTSYKDWSERRLSDIEAIENEDYEVLLKNERNSKGGRPQKDHIVKLDTAKEMAMLERNEKGKQVRRYFIQVERKYKEEVHTKLPQGKELLALAVLEAQKTIEQQKEDIARMRPKEIFADAVSTSKASILVGELAKILKQNGVEIGQKRMFTWLRNNGYLIKRNGSDYNMPTQKSMELGLFEIKETVISRSNGHVTISKTPKVTGKGQQYFINKFIGEVA